MNLYNPIWQGTHILTGKISYVIRGIMHLKGYVSIETSLYKRSWRVIVDYSILWLTPQKMFQILANIWLIVFQNNFFELCFFWQHVQFCIKLYSIFGFIRHTQTYCLVCSIGFWHVPPLFFLAWASWQKKLCKPKSFQIPRPTSMRCVGKWILVFGFPVEKLGKLVLSE